MSKKIRAAVLGLGRLGYWHAVNVVTRIRNAELAAICDVDMETAKRVATELDVPFFTTDPEDILKDDTIGVMIIASPTSTHFDLLKKASEAGKSIFVEKPLTIDLSEANEIKRIIENNNTICQVGFMRRFDPAYVAAKNRINAGDIGDPIYFRGISRDPHSPHEAFIQHSGGMFVDVSIHDFDIARYLMNSEVTSVHAHGRILKYPFMEKYQDIDQSLTYLEFSSGAAGDAEASRNAHYGYDIRGEVIGTEGSIFIGNLRNHDIQILTKSGNLHDILPDFPTRFTDAYHLELASFFQVVEDRGIPSVTVDDGIKALEIAFAARESYQTGKKVELNSLSLW
ncbi:Gfo/Idh/MocA family oxidoreductase [Peribacillus sp. NJ11]|uniref:Gfo/Idh/MocA family oxidoreductase n=1 Tax=Peribacillus sp. NJ11 TaxID=3055861 RepID=UPI0025A04446|nr:Gfo/Idh/MocA family oxidoreductase [Peribacillus sp. NJ11]MDM5224238.1 Gfo/Idh/MocA family oxidoreductase [Peribacillus sp. NJ11]